MSVRRRSLIAEAPSCGRHEWSARAVPAGAEDHVRMPRRRLGIPAGVMGSDGRTKGLFLWWRRGSTKLAAPEGPRFSADRAGSQRGTARPPATGRP